MSRTARHNKSDQKHTVAKRPRVAAVRIGDKSKAKPRTMSDYAYEECFVSIVAIHNILRILSD